MQVNVWKSLQKTARWGREFGMRKFWFSDVHAVVALSRFWCSCLTGSVCFGCVTNVLRLMLQSWFFHVFSGYSCGGCFEKFCVWQWRLFCLIRLCLFSLVWWFENHDVVCCSWHVFLDFCERFCDELLALVCPRVVSGHIRTRRICRVG